MTIYEALSPSLYCCFEIVNKYIVDIPPKGVHPSPFKKMKVLDMVNAEALFILKNLHSGKMTRYTA